MRIFRPSTRAAAIAGALALTLMVAGTSGAVAAKLITSKQIKDHTISAADMGTDSVTNDNIAPGAVNWSKSLDDATKNRIAKLLGDGVPGPTGATGPQGQQGPVGPQGPVGATGAPGTSSGNLLAEEFYGLNGYSATGDNNLAEVYGLNPEPITLTGPGNFLVNMNGIFADTGAFEAPFMFLGDPSMGNELDTIMNACLPAQDFFVPTCQANFPVSVAEGDTLTLPLLVPAAIESPCDTECDPLAFARVAVYQLGGNVPEVTQFPGDLCCTRSSTRPFTHRQLSKFAQHYRKYLS